MMIRDLISRFLGWWADLPVPVRLILLALATGSLAMLAGRPAYRHLKDWRLERNLVHAREALEADRPQEARDLSLTVLRAGDPRVEAVRILERSAASLKDPRHSEIARALIAHPKGTDDDRLTGFRGVVDRIPLGLVGQVWMALPDHCRTDKRFALAFAGRLLAEQRHAEAASVLLAVPEADRDRECARALVRVLIASGRQEGYEEAQHRIAAAYPMANDDRMEWLELLESVPPLRLHSALLQPVSQALAEENGARAALMLARIDYSNRFAARSTIIGEAVGKWKDREPAELARFLAALGLHGHMLEVFPDGRPAMPPALRDRLLQAACVTGDWERLESLLDGMQGEPGRLREMAWRAAIAAHTSDAAGRSEAWAAAMTEASGMQTDDAYLILHRVALEAGLPDEAHQALLAAIRTGRGPLPLYNTLKPLLHALAGQGQERAIMEVAAIYLAFEPGNPVLITQYAYLACLNDLAEPTTILQALEPMATALPHELPLQFAVAFAHLCNHRPGLAAAVLDPLDLDPASLSPQFRVILLVTRLLNGHIAPADPAIRELPWQKLLPSERRKLNELVRKAQK